MQSIIASWSSFTGFKFDIASLLTTDGREEPRVPQKFSRELQVLEAAAFDFRRLRSEAPIGGSAWWLCVAIVG